MFMYKRKNTALLLLLFSFLISSCVSYDNNDDDTVRIDGIRFSTEYHQIDFDMPVFDGYFQVLTDTCYSDSQIALLGVADTVESITAYNNWMNDSFYTQNVPTDSEGNICLPEYYLFLLDLQGNVVAKTLIKSDNGGIYSYPELSFDESGNIHAIVEVRSQYDFNMSYYDYVFNQNGELIDTIQLYFEVGLTVRNVAIDSDDHIYTLCSDDYNMYHLLEFDTDGVLLHDEDDIANNVSDLINIDGSVYAVTYRFIEDDTHTLIVPFDKLIENDLDDVYSINGYFSYLSPSQECVYYYNDIENTIDSYNIIDSSCRSVVDLDEYDFMISPVHFHVYDGQIIFCGGNGIDYNTYIACMTSVNEEYQEDRKTIRLAGVGIDDDVIIDYLVKQFNNTNKDYRIVICDYLNDNDDTNPLTSAISRFFLDYNNGDAPDIVIDINGEFPFETIANSDCFIDLSDNIDSTTINDAFIHSDSQYSINAGYMISGLITYSSNESIMHTYDDYFRLEQSLDPDVSAVLSDFSSDYLTDQMLRLCYTTFFDSLEGSVSFDSDAFRQMLQWIRDVSSHHVILEAYEDYLITEGYTMYDDICVDSPLFLLALLNYSRFTSDIAITGYPTYDGSIIGYKPVYNIAITNTTTSEDAAWEFASMILDYDIQLVIGRSYFPVCQDAFDRQLLASYRDYYLMGFIDKYDPDYVIEYINNILSSDNIVVENYDEDVFAIVREETARYFADDLSLDEVADIIQSRAELIMDERS